MILFKKKFEDECLNLDYLIYSSHKTGTQSLLRTLKANGFKTRHCHYYSNLGLESGGLRECLEKYAQRRNKKLNVITVFREPIERHVSSFFQVYGTRPLRIKEVKNETETIIHKYTIEELQEAFISELSTQSLVGYMESLSEMCQELQITTDDLSLYRKEDQFSVYEANNIRLYLIRFDDLVKNFESLLCEITDKKIKVKLANMSAAKWYKNIYAQFKHSLIIPHDTISDVYNSKRDIINFVYADDFDARLDLALSQYGRK